MKNYILKNFQSVLLGVLIGIIFMILKEMTESILTKIAILINK
jgi:hypothetical protein